MYERFRITHSKQIRFLGCWFVSFSMWQPNNWYKATSANQNCSKWIRHKWIFEQWVCIATFTMLAHHDCKKKGKKYCHWGIIWRGYVQNDSRCSSQFRPLTVFFPLMLLRQCKVVIKNMEKKSLCHTLTFSRSRSVLNVITMSPCTFVYQQMLPCAKHYLTCPTNGEIKGLPCNVIFVKVFCTCLTRFAFTFSGIFRNAFFSRGLPVYISNCAIFNGSQASFISCPNDLILNCIAPTCKQTCSTWCRLAPLIKYIWLLKGSIWK